MREKGENEEGLREGQENEGDLRRGGERKGRRKIRGRDEKKGNEIKYGSGGGEE